MKALHVSKSRFIAAVVVLLVFLFLTLSFCLSFFVYENGAHEQIWGWRGLVSNGFQSWVLGILASLGLVASLDDFMNKKDWEGPKVKFFILLLGMFFVVSALIHFLNPRELLGSLVGTVELGYGAFMFFLFYLLRR